MKSIQIYVSFFLLITLVFSSCKKNEKIIEDLSVVADNENTYSLKSRPVMSSKRSADVSKNFSEAIQNQPLVKRKLIKNGNVTFETFDISETRKNIEAAIKNCKGYISSDNEYKIEDRLSVTINARIPSKDFDVFFAEISKGVEKFDNKNINVRDVTEQFLDVAARLKTKKKLEERYLVLLKKAISVQEILSVERQLANVRSEIESNEGRLKYLNNQVGYSTLNINFYKKTRHTPNFLRQVAQSFSKGIENIKELVLSLISFWPFLLLIVIAIFVFRRLQKN